MIMINCYYDYNDGNFWMIQQSDMITVTQCSTGIYCLIEWTILDTEIISYILYFCLKSFQHVFEN